MALFAAPPVLASDGRCFELRVQPDREKVYVEPVGELDLATTVDLREQVSELIAIGFEHVVIDLRALTFLDVSGLRLLLLLTTTAQDNGWRLSLIHGTGAVRRIFALTDTLERLPFTTATR